MTRLHFAADPATVRPVLCRTRSTKELEVAIELYEALKAAGVPEDTARASAKAIEEASRVNTKLTVLMWTGGILAGGTIAGFALVTTQLIRLTGGVSGLTTEVGQLAAQVAALAEIVRAA